MPVGQVPELMGKTGMNRHGSLSPVPKQVQPIQVSLVHVLAHFWDALCVRWGRKEHIAGLRMSLGTGLAE